MKSTFILASIVLLALTMVEKQTRVLAEGEKTLPKDKQSASYPLEIGAKNQENYQISSQGIGIAKLGMTYQELKKNIGSHMTFRAKTNFMVDWDAIELSQKGQVQYRILYPANTTLKNTDMITVLQTENPQYLTDKGVGSGTLIKKAVSIYGKPTLSYHLGNEGREFVRLAKQPENIHFRSGNYGDHSLSGIYSKKAAEYQETNQYKPGAKIQSVEVICPPTRCQK